MLKYFFNRYTAAAIAVQFISCLAFWIFASISPAGVRFFRLLVYFYAPTIYLVLRLHLDSESAVIAAYLYGIFLGVLIYSFIIGLVLLFAKERRRRKRSANIRNGSLN